MGPSHLFCRIAIIVVCDFDADWYGSYNDIRVAIKADKKCLCPHAIYYYAADDLNHLLCVAFMKKLNQNL